MKKILLSPYPYILLVTYYGVWLMWSGVKVPYSDPYGVVGALTVARYNPTNNILRFLLAIFLPPLACLGFWILQRWVPSLKQARPLLHRRLSIIMSVVLVALSLVILLGVAIKQASTSGTNPPDIYGGPYSHTLVDTFHEGETLGSSVSYSQPNLKPYKDMVFVHGVFQDPVRSILAFKLFGRGIGAERAFSSILIIITFMLSFGLLLVLFKMNVFKASLATLLLGFIILPSNFLPVIGSYIIGYQLPSLDFQTIFFLVAAILGIRALQAAKYTLLGVYSFLLGLITFAGYANALDRAFFLSAVAIVWLIMIVVMLPWRRFMHIVLPYFIAGSLLGIAVLGIALKWDFVDFLSFVYHITLFKELMDGSVFTRPDKATSAALLALVTVITYAGAQVVIRLDIKSSDRRSIKALATKLRSVFAQLFNEYYVFVLLLAVAVFYLRSAIGRADVGHFSYSLYWTYLLLIYLLVNYLLKLSRPVQQLVRYLAVFLLLFTAVYYAYHIKQTDLASNTFPIHVSDSQLTRPDYLQTANFLKKNLHGKDTFMTFTSEGFWYYIVDKPSPVKYPIVWFAAANYQQKELAQELSSDSHIKYVITNTNWTSDIDFVPVEQRVPEAYHVLTTKYTPYIGFGQQTIWIRK